MFVGKHECMSVLCMHEYQHMYVLIFVYMYECLGVLMYAFMFALMYEGKQA